MFLCCVRTTRHSSQALVRFNMLVIIIYDGKSYRTIYIRVLGSENELPAKIIDVLNKEDINSEKILLALSNEDIKGLGLSLGHKTLLKNAIANINRTNTMGGTRAMANQDLCKDAKLQEVVDSLANSGAFLDNGLLSNLQDQT